MKWEDGFIADYNNLSEGELYKKYYGNIPTYVSVAGIVNRVVETNVSNMFIDENWYGDRRDSKTFFLISSGSDHYEVFQSERGGKHRLTFHTNLEDALNAKLFLLLHALGCE